MSPHEKHDAGVFQGRAIQTACLRPNVFPAEPIFNDVIQRLRHCGTCVLAHEQEYGTVALYVNSPTPLSDILPQQLLNVFDVQPQIASIFKLCQPFDGERIQRALNACAACHSGLNAAVVDIKSCSLTVFKDPLANGVGNETCVVGITWAGVRDESKGAVHIYKAPQGAAQGLEILKQSLLNHPVISKYHISIDIEINVVVVQPQRDEELLIALHLVAKLIEGLGLRCEFARSRRLAQLARHVVLPVCCEAQIEIPADCKEFANYPNVGSDAVVPKIVEELGYMATLVEWPQDISFPLGGMKCGACAERLTTHLLTHLPGLFEHRELYVTLMRDSFLVSTSAVEGDGFLQALKAGLQAKGFQYDATALLPPASWTDIEQELTQHAQMVQQTSGPFLDCKDTDVAEVALRAGSLECPHCISLLQKALYRGACVKNMAANAAESSLLIEYAGGSATMENAIHLLTNLGYEPVISENGAHLVEILQDLLSVHSSPSLQSSDSDTVGPPSLTHELGGSMIYTAKLYTARELMLAELLLHGTPDSGYALLVKEPSGSQLPVDQHPAPLFLESEYTIWYDKVVDRSKPNAPEGTLVELESFRTLQDFWQIWTQFDLNGLQEGDVLMVFRRDVQPNIHHPVNKAGGRWYTRALPLELRGQLWTGLVVAMLGEYLKDHTSNEVCGVVLSVKPGGDRIEVWVDGDYHHSSKAADDQITSARQPGPTMGDLLAQVLQLNPGRHRLHYWTHVAYERHRKLHSGSARRDKRKHKMAGAAIGLRSC